MPAWARLSDSARAVKERHWALTIVGWKRYLDPHAPAECAQNRQDGADPLRAAPRFASLSVLFIRYDMTGQNVPIADDRSQPRGINEPSTRGGWTERQAAHNRWNWLEDRVADAPAGGFLRGAGPGFLHLLDEVGQAGSG